MGKKTLHPLSTNRLREGVGRKTSRGEVGLIHCANSYADSLSISPGGGYDCCMKEMHKHTSHPDLVKRLKRAEGHLREIERRGIGHRASAQRMSSGSLR